MSQAKSGGEIGANGEFYKGGQFIATKDRPKTKYKKKTGKREINRYQWVLAPAENLRPLMSILVEFCVFTYTEKGQFDQATPAHTAKTWNAETLYENFNIDPVKVELACEKWNQGERWISEDFTIRKK